MRVRSGFDWTDPVDETTVAGPNTASCGSVGRELVDNPRAPPARHHRIAARQHDVRRCVPRPVEPVRKRVPHRRGRAAWIAVVIVGIARPPQHPVVGKRIGLNEARGIGRVPGAAVVLPLLVDRGHQLEVMRQVFGDRHLERAGSASRSSRCWSACRRCPDSGSTRPNPPKRLIRAVRVDAVDVRLREHVVDLAVDEPRHRG